MAKVTIYECDICKSECWKNYRNIALPVWFDTEQGPDRLTTAIPYSEPRQLMFCSDCLSKLVRQLPIRAVHDSRGRETYDFRTDGNDYYIYKSEPDPAAVNEPIVIDPDGGRTKPPQVAHYGLIDQLLDIADDTGGARDLSIRHVLAEWVRSRKPETSRNIIERTETRILTEAVPATADDFERALLADLGDV